MNAPMKLRIFEALCGLQDLVNTYGRSSDDSIKRLADELTPFGHNALAAIQGWPHESDDWPTLKQIMASARRAASEARADNLLRESEDSPVGRFIRLVANSDAGGKDYVYNWLDADANCRFTQCQIFTTSHGAERLNRDWKEQLQKLKVEVIHEKDQDEKLKTFVEKMYADGKLKRRA